MKISKRAMGLSLGIVWGVAIFCITLWAMARGQGETLRLLKGYYLGYNVTFGGAVIGLLWGFLDGFIGGALIACLYNTFYKIFYKTEASA